MQRLAELCVRRPVLSRVITLAMVALGVFAFLGLNVSRYPNVELPIITVVTPCQQEDVSKGSQEICAS